MLNALSIDVEDYFQVSAFERHVRRDDWDHYSLRVEGNTSRILDMLDRFGVKATFFVLGWIAEKRPLLIREIAKRGHEIASHGYGHLRVYNQTRKEFRNDIRRSKVLLEDLIGTQVIGYRAPSYSISQDCLWAFDELLDAGYHYDSSVFPVHHDLYGIPHWPRFPFFVIKGVDKVWIPEQLPCEKGGTGASQRPRIMEIPITTLAIAGRNIPIAGGGYFRFFPYFFSHWGLRRINRQERRSFVFYIHPWELDPKQPRIIGVSPKSRFRHYVNLRRTEARFQRLLGDFCFSTIRDVYLFTSAPYPMDRGDRKPDRSRDVLLGELHA